jgi:mRNA-degrading endonuclease toxin of MazEF toxin-antitoxin module
VRLQQGSIVWVRVADAAGRNPKCRPAVVVTPTAEITPGETILVVAATGMFDLPLSPNQVELPWHRNRHPLTGLTKRCVAVCDWLVEIDPSYIDRVGGLVPSAVLADILARIPRDPS